jgi:uncharacterized delta-60 repeat protein
MTRNSDNRVRLLLDPLEARDVPTVVGGLDPSFGTGGKVIALSGTAGGGDVAVDSLGRVVVAGNTGPAATQDFLITRFNKDGTLDTTFGTGGSTKVDFGGLEEDHAVVIDANDNVIAAGLSVSGGTSNMAFVRLLGTTGLPDPTFGGATGTKLVPLAVGGTGAVDVTLDAGGNIVAVGSSPSAAGDNDFAFVRLLPTGAIDPTFNAGAVKTVPLAGSTEFGNGVAVDATGNIVGVGSSIVTPGGTTFKFAAVRLLANGTVDPAFNGGAIKLFTAAATTSDQAMSVDTDAANNVYLSGTSNDGAATPTVSAAVAKLTTAGALDPTFGTAGIFLSTAGGAAGSSTGGSDLQLQPSGRIVVAGSHGAGGAALFDFYALRLLANGTLDTSFNPTGTTPGVNVFDLGASQNDAVGEPGLGRHGLALTPEGRIVIAGRNTTVAGGAVEVARLIGTVEKGVDLAVSGATNGSVKVFAPTPATGQYATTPAATLTPFSGFTGNVRAAVADVNGDGFGDTIVVTGPGTAPVRFTVISGADNTTVLVPPTDPFGNATFNGGGFVSAGDFNNDGRAEWVITPDQGGGPNVVIYSLVGTTATVQKTFLGIDDPNFRGGARSAVGDFNGDGVADLAVAAGFLGGPRVALFDGKTVFATPTRLVGDFFAFGGSDATNLRNGVFVAAGDVNGDGFADLIAGGGPGGAPRVLTISGKVLTGTGAGTGIDAAQAAPLMNFFVAGNDADRGGVRLAAVDADGDNKADVAAGSGEGSPSKVRVYLGKNVTSSAEPTTSQDLDPFGATLAGGVFVG